MTENQALNKFKEHYITSVEICERLGVSRTAVFVAHRTGRLPEGFKVDRMMMWEREAAEPFIKTWQNQLEQRDYKNIASS